MAEPAIDYAALARALMEQGLPQAIAASLATASAPAELVTKDDLASRWRVSTATIDRMVRQGMPVEWVTGDAKRFNVAACDAWRRSRPVSPRPTPDACGNEADSVSMEGVRRVSGGGRGGR